MKKILVPTDFSIQAQNALKVAAMLAKKLNCELYLLHVLEIPIHKVDPLSSYNNLPEAIYYMKLAQKKFETLKEMPFLKNLVVHEFVEFHEIFKGIYHLTKKNDIDLIVMGSSGASGFKEIVIGSNTEKVVRTSEVPVLIIKNEHNEFSVNEFVFASDFCAENEIPFEKAIKFAAIFGSKINLLMINTPNKFLTTRDALDTMENFSRKFNYPNLSLNIYNDLSIEKGIINFSKLIKADLIGMSTHGRKGISHFFNGSISEDLVNHAKKPVITFRI